MTDILAEIQHISKYFTSLETKRDEKCTEKISMPKDFFIEHEDSLNMIVSGSFQLLQILKKIKLARLFGHAFQRLPTQGYVLVQKKM